MIFISEMTLIIRDGQVIKYPKVCYYYFFRAQACPVFLYRQLVREGLKFISIIKLEWGKLGEKNFKIFFGKIGAQKWILDILRGRNRALFYVMI